jgi:hypothetical protein
VSVASVHPIRALGGVGLVLLLLAAAGCGGDDENEKAATGAGPRTQTTEATQTQTSPSTEKTTATAPAKTTTTEPTSPEDQPGGAGDEEPARSQAQFTGRAGRIGPRVVRVPAFIAIRVELRSADGGTYALRFGRRTLRAGGDVSSVSAEFDGMRTGESLIGRPIGAGNAVRVVANAEPGP